MAWKESSTSSSRQIRVQATPDCGAGPCAGPFSFLAKRTTPSNQISARCLIGAVSGKAQAKQIIDFRIFLC